MDSIAFAVLIYGGKAFSGWLDTVDAAEDRAEDDPLFMFWSNNQATNDLLAEHGSWRPSWLDPRFELCCYASLETPDDLEAASQRNWAGLATAIVADVSTPLYLRVDSISVTCRDMLAYVGTVFAPGESPIEVAVDIDHAFRRCESKREWDEVANTLWEARAILRAITRSNKGGRPEGSGMLHDIRELVSNYAEYERKHGKRPTQEEFSRHVDVSPDTLVRRLKKGVEDGDLVKRWPPRLADTAS